ncbi:hypothetical protein [Tissierella praeacuta]|uniref:hypothetical protein n=1 Tax=Tissierella praeacuta TaxID=43131 RepID=UPI003341BA96
MITNKRDLVRGFTMFALLIMLSLFILNTKSYAEPVDISPRAIDCGDCRKPAPTYIDKSYARTDKSGEDCKHCSIRDHHNTDVYSVKKVVACPNGCTYRVLEYLPNEYKCYR